jgi:hypothetical protein
MLERREFTLRPNLALLSGLLVFLVTMFVLSLVAFNTHIIVVDERSAMIRAFLRTIGILGVPAFGMTALALASLIPKIRKSKRASLVLDGTTLQYGGIKIPWPLIREALVCKYFGRRYIGIRTVNDLAMVKKMDEVLSNRLPSILLVGFHYQQWRTQCPLLIPGAQEITVDELQSLIEQYRAAFTDDKTAETLTTA